MLSANGLVGILLAVTTVPSAFGSSLRHLDAMEYQAVMSAPPISCYVENGFDYAGYDIKNVPGDYTSCCSACAATPGCKTWSWSNLNGGTCWLKWGRGDIVVNPNVKSAVFFYGQQPYCQASQDIDFVGNDLARVNGASVDACCDICQKYAGCRAYSWTDHQGGSCWLKSKVTQVVVKAGVKSAEAYPDINQGCSTWSYDTDYEGNDIANKPSATHGGCCDICKATPGCRAYSWTNQNGGTCWLKSLKGNTITKSGVISSQVYPNPPKECKIENNVDYVGNDVWNVPGKDVNVCCGIAANIGYTAFSWSDYNGGTCWLKSGKGATVSKTGVKSAVLQ